ncbi:bacteriophage lambda NinG [Pseudomonas laurentiana]|uniref:Recombination protein NinG n=1 Tax=Pseudomonas laurentiana TaxID=2364649 RepID=A0A6I5RUT6_9PSED|nr:recombination protein NinG [Pseudomonas laurentiana]NES11108.1 recombination protein NinG [Pseudomonas laurentiana]GGU79191.1 bacteriophage lambda NinG [Pseudomonas laurentiana]
MITKQPRPKTCNNPACGISFSPRRLGQAVCSPACGLAIKDVNQDKARKAIAQRERREIKVRKDKLKGRADYAKEAQAAINRYVRLRDAHLGCISCDKPASWQGQWHCSHFRSVGAAPHLRFNLWNMNKSCSACNNFLSGNIMAYRPALIEKIGQDKVDWLECSNGLLRHDIPYLKRVKAIFTKKASRIEKRIEGVQSWVAV